MFQGAAVLACLAEVGSSAPDYARLWSEFKDKYGKKHASNEAEQSRYAIFKQNVDFMHETNAKKLTFTLGVNQFADLTLDEFKATSMGYKKPANAWANMTHLGSHVYSGEMLPDAVDWTTNGAVTPVKDQGQCGSCWAFSTTGSLEGAWQIATGKLVSLSEQEFVDCDQVDSGCNGGLMDNGFTFAEHNPVCTEESYGYKAVGGACQMSSCTVAIPGGSVTGFKDVTSDNKEMMMSAVAKQPVSIAIEADSSIFQMYSGGILSGWCGTSLDHGVLLVGYGTDGGKDYWKVKNSWGTSYGEKGYVRMTRGKGGAGECGVLKQGSYPVVKSSIVV